MSFLLLLAAVAYATDVPPSALQGEPAQKNAASDAASSAPALPCSDHQEGFPSCGISEAEARKANALYREAEKLLRDGRFEEALGKIEEAREISPRDVVFSTTGQAVRTQASSEQVKLGEQAMQVGDVNAALAAFRHALELDPGNDYAAERLHAALPPEQHIAPTVLEAASSETYLLPQPGTRNFAFKGPSPAALQSFAALFGISAVPEQGLVARNVRAKLDNVDWETGSRIMQRLCKVLMIPLGDREVLLANDTEQNRRELVPMGLQTYYSLGTPQQITELSTGLRTLFNLRFLATNPSKGTITVRAPQGTLQAISQFLADLRSDQPGVMMEIKVFQLSTTFTRDLGVSVPTEFTVFNIPTEIQKLVSGGSLQQILAALQASGQNVNASTILAALLATSSASSPLAQPFATFGGGITLSGVTIPSTSFHFSDTTSLARTMQDVMLLSQHGSEATLKIGSRYPVITSVFAATLPQTSILSSFGLSSALEASTSAPLPQFSYEDLGLVLKTTPQIHGDLVSLNFELTLRAIAATQPNGPPTISNRESKGTISTEDGQPVVIAGEVDRTEIATLNGIPALSALPVIGYAFTLRNHQKQAGELLIVITPHITRERRPHGVYIPLPANEPK